MASAAARAVAQRPWFEEKFLLGLRPGRLREEPAAPGRSPPSHSSWPSAIPLIVYRFVYGLGAATNLSQDTPWGLWIGLDMLSGVALAAGGYTIATTVHIFGWRTTSPIVRPALLTGFLGYLFAVIGLMRRPRQPVEPAGADGRLLRHDRR